MCGAISMATMGNLPITETTRIIEPYIHNNPNDTIYGSCSNMIRAILLTVVTTLQCTYSLVLYGQTTSLCFSAVYPVHPKNNTKSGLAMHK